jgi:hypothetical protein
VIVVGTAAIVGAAAAGQTAPNGSLPPGTVDLGQSH